MIAQLIADGEQYPRLAQPGEPPKEDIKGQKGNIPPPQGATRGAPLPPQAASAPGKFTPTQQSDVYYEPDPNAEMQKGKKGKEGKPKDVKLKSNKDAKTAVCTTIVSLVPSRETNTQQIQHSGSYKSEP
jgi:hypothetical protein